MEHSAAQLDPVTFELHREGDGVPRYKRGEAQMPAKVLLEGASHLIRESTSCLFVV
jgi:hypothetical protein